MRKIEAQIRFEEDTIDLLKADWSLLTQPSRLQKLAEIYQAELPCSRSRRTRSSGSTSCRQNRSRSRICPAQRLGGMADKRQGQDKTVDRRRRAMIGLHCASDRRASGARSRRAGSIVVEGARKATGGKAKNRVVMTMAVFFGIYATIAGRLVYLGMQDPEHVGRAGRAG